MPNTSTYRYWLVTSLLLLLTTLFSVRAQTTTYNAVVAQDGSGNFRTVQAAINAAPDNGTTLYTIFIKQGRYREKITVPATKPFLQLVGESVANTVLTYNDGASTPLPGGGTVGTQNSASFTVNANDFSALNLTFENSYGDGTQAVAVLVNADRAAFRNCRFLGNQDTLYTKGNGTPRHYFRDCYVDGNVDFIFGSSIGVFDNCVVYAKSRTTVGSSFITAANTPAGQAAGYVFRKTRFPANTGATQYALGRPWQNSTGSSPLANNKTVLINSRLSASIRPEGWVTWDAGTDVSLITYGEFRSRYFGGQLVPVAQRVAWSKQLAVADTAAYLTSTLFGTWNPAAIAGFGTATAQPAIAVANLKVEKGATTSTISWNTSWPQAQITYELFRSVDRAAATKVGELTAATDTTVNFQLTDAVPPLGSAYYYFVRAAKTGQTAHVTDSVRVSSVPTLTVTGSLGTFTQYAGGPSAAQSYTLAGENLTAPVIITPPAGYEVSANGTTWSTSASPLSLAPTAGVLAATPVSVRLNAAAVGSYVGSISHASTGAAAVTAAVTGIATNQQQLVSVVLQQWPLTTSAADDAAVRSVAVTASTPTLKRLFVSNGTTVATVPAYSAAFGQALGVTSNGDGSWGTASGGPGGNLNRRFYEQFTVTAAAGQAVRLDSLLLTAGFYNTSSNTKLAVVYSRSNFTADSVDVTGGTGPGGALAASANGAFATPIALANQFNGLTNRYHLALNGGTGLNLTAGQTLTVRLYFSCGSSSPGRYSLLQNVAVKGNRTTTTGTLAARQLVLAAFPNPTTGQLTLSHPAAPAGATVSIFAFDGRRVARFLSKPGTTATLLNVAGLTAGHYLVRYAAGTEHGTSVIVKE
ncbi:pectinesterase family protein [Hymenobacter perfusus]|uniref:T9SS C-terminal target domain-containing protein n=1 Tax=Hymenobacter perfusus TaxID=1236770 RepID=A0A3R9P864_9BACT|nr:pectinesterase family protein [Hymenobacter perfusus]RSK46318.1 T9SS C-terminal target domain-containing protein [Hymenobacter perfusus]